MKESFCAPKVPHLEVEVSILIGDEDVAGPEAQVTLAEHVAHHLLSGRLLVGVPHKLPKKNNNLFQSVFRIRVILIRNTKFNITSLL